MTQSASFFEYKNVMQSTLIFALKKCPPPPPISKIQLKIALRKVSGFLYIKTKRKLS